MTGASLWFQCEGYYHIALCRLGDGDRAAARKYFPACLDTNVLMFVEYAWSRAFLARLERDPNWPPWIPPSPSATKPATQP